MPRTPIETLKKQARSTSSTPTSISEGEQLAASYGAKMEVRLERDAASASGESLQSVPVIGRKVSSPELSALAGRYVGMQHAKFVELATADDRTFRAFTDDVRRLAASVLSQDETP